MDEQQHEYNAPEVEDLGTLEDLTQAVAFTGAEDGGSKLLIHHSAPMFP
jgi:hypothetical protein